MSEVFLSAESIGADVKVYQTSRAGDSMKAINTIVHEQDGAVGVIELYPSITYQKIVGIGGSFTESTAHALSGLSVDKRQEVIEAYFGQEGANYSLTRTHIGSCDFSLGNYTYAPVADDFELNSFSMDHDRELLFPLIKDAQAVEGADFKILASPWTAPPWMKDNNHWNGGKLKSGYGDVYADYLIRYVDAMKEEGMPIWGLTPVNEPEGNDANWESMHFNPEEMRDFIAEHLGPKLEARKLDTKVLIFDQNRNHLDEWTETVLGDPKAAAFVHGTAVHWYSSTVDVCEEALESAHERFPDKMIMHTEGCIDALGDDEPEGVWLDPDWYWRAEATDWGWIWAPEELKKDHPKYVPVYRYIRDMIGGLNHWMTGWIDWNMVLDFRGGPNHASNFCGAPVLVDGESNEILYTPIYYAMCHFSRFIRPGATRIGFGLVPEGLMATAFSNPDESIAVVVFNEGNESKSFSIKNGEKVLQVSIPAQAIQTIVIE